MQRGFVVGVTGVVLLVSLFVGVDVLFAGVEGLFVGFD
jgi:hypothetical protein